MVFRIGAPSFADAHRRDNAGVTFEMIPQIKGGSGQDKVLTVSIAAYNAKATLPKALDSCLTSGAERLEVIVVDDGSADDTAQVAEEYAARWPGIFRVIRQPNGGYGSVQMTALGQANGKYFRTLDSDDWFDPDALTRLLQYLESCSTDAVFTNYCTVRNNQIQDVFSVCGGHKEGRVYTFDTLEQPALDMEIHALTCRTQMLRAAGIRLLPHCSYTDMAYTFLSMSAAQTMSFCPVNLYHYRLGRDGQSVSIESYQKHFEDYVRVTEQILDAADLLPWGSKGKILRGRARDIAQYGIELLLRFAPERKVRERLEAYDRALRKEHPDIAAHMYNKNTKMLRYSRYSLYGLLNFYAKNKQRRKA